MCLTFFYVCTMKKWTGEGGWNYIKVVHWIVKGHIYRKSHVILLYSVINLSLQQFTYLSCCRLPCVEGRDRFDWNKTCSLFVYTGSQKQSRWAFLKDA